MSWVRAPRWEFLFSILAGPRAYSINGPYASRFSTFDPAPFLWFYTYTTSCERLDTTLNPL